MDLVEPVLAVASSIYNLVGEVQANRKRCQRVADRVRALEGPVTAIQKRGLSSGSASSHVTSALEDLKLTLDFAEELMRRYSSGNFLKRMVKAYDHGEDFGSVNERLNDSYQVLSLALQVDQGSELHRAFETRARRAEDVADSNEDHAELQRMLQQSMDSIQKVAESTQSQVQDLRSTMENLIQTIKQPRILTQDIREIRADELTFELEPFMTTATSEVYKGEFNKFPVAIKKYTLSGSTPPKEVRKVFRKETETMRRFESPNILRMFGICVQDEDGPTATYLIVMEYCEKGSLRQVLDSRSKLSWTRKARMSLDAAKGLYRLHHTEEKARVHGCLTSSKFLVTEGYKVKLAGFELAKTETSLKKPCSGQPSSLRYSSPQQLGSVNHCYSKKCEMYSFGIILWEISTRKNPFEDCSSRQEIFKRVCEEKALEALPSTCPRDLARLVNACRAYDDFRRPSAGVLVDKLSRVVEHLDSD